MPAWLIAALRMLAAGGLFAGGTELVARAAGGDPMALPASGPSFLPSFLADGVFQKKSRRRRRRALTASDKADIAFIAGILGKPAGKDIAAIIAARTG